MRNQKIKIENLKIQQTIINNNNKNELIINNTYKNKMNTYCVKCKKDTENVVPKIVRKNQKVY